MKERKSHLYLIPNEKNRIGGDFYNIYISRGEKLDLSRFYQPGSTIAEVETQMKKIDPTFKKIGGIILNQGEMIDSTFTFIPKNATKELEEYQLLKEYIDLSIEQGEVLKKQMKELEKTQAKIKRLQKKSSR